MRGNQDKTGSQAGWLAATCFDCPQPPATSPHACLSGLAVLSRGRRGEASASGSIPVPWVPGVTLGKWAKEAYALQAGTPSRYTVQRMRAGDCNLDSAPAGTVVWTNVDNVGPGEAPAILPWRRPPRCCGMGRQREEGYARTAMHTHTREAQL